jgi:hypothetical protein
MLILLNNISILNYMKTYHKQVRQKCKCSLSNVAYLPYSLMNIDSTE